MADIFPQLRKISLKALFCQANRTKPKHISFTAIYKREKQQILPLEKLERMNVWFSCFINDINYSYQNLRGLLLHQWPNRLIG